MSEAQFSTIRLSIFFNLALVVFMMFSQQPPLIIGDGQVEGLVKQEFTL